MLKTVQVGKKKIPVPVPLKHLADAIEWVEDIVVRHEGTLTKVVLDGEEIEDFHSKKWGKRKLSKSSSLHVQVDSPWNICMEILSTVSDFSEAISQSAHMVAVGIWDTESVIPPQSIVNAYADSLLIVELVQHLSEIVDYTQEDIAGVLGQYYILKRQVDHLGVAMRKKQWRDCARFLVRRVAPILRDLLRECEQLQMSMMASQAV
ncbi:MAG: hypothetical protein OXT67_13715 [Zetaproteobacteria bacterium]|nr:hypothetical protein [Zetaproteobacteria bacterium]